MVLLLGIDGNPERKESEIYVNEAMRLKPNDSMGNSTDRNACRNKWMKECEIRGIFRQLEVMFKVLPPNSVIWSVSILREIDVRVGRPSEWNQVICVPPSHRWNLGRKHRSLLPRGILHPGRLF
jgi:hypothetical protein